MWSKALFSLAVLAASAEAFTSPSALPLRAGARGVASPAAFSRVRMQAEDVAGKQDGVKVDTVKAAIADATKEFDEVQPVATGGTDYSNVKKTEPTPLFLLPSTSVIGDGAMVGDKGFDPLGLATDMPTLKKYREAELKHCRLAMLAALGWPVAEVLQGPLSKALGMPDLLSAGATCAAGNYACQEALTRAPSVLNGGLEKISPAYWGAVIAFSAAVEFYGQKIQKKDNYLPGDLGFDPLGLYQKNGPEGKLDLQLKELNNGRLAMIAITGYAFNEAATKISVAQSLGLPQ